MDASQVLPVAQVLIILWGVALFLLHSAMRQHRNALLSGAGSAALTLALLAISVTSPPGVALLLASILAVHAAALIILFVAGRLLVAIEVSRPAPALIEPGKVRDAAR